MGYIKLVKANIIEYQGIEAIVNSTNRKFSARGGLDAVIHAKAGKQFDSACKKVKGEKNKAYIFPGFDLPYDYVISISVWTWDKHNEEESKNKLRDSYRNILQAAKEHGIKSIAFPSLGTKARKIPDVIAAEIAVDTVNEFLNEDSGCIEEVSFIVSEAYRFKLYKSTLERKNIEYFNVNEFFRENISTDVYLERLNLEGDGLSELVDEALRNYEILCDDSKDIVIKKGKACTGVEMEDIIRIAIENQDIIIDTARNVAKELGQEDTFKKVEKIVPKVVKLTPWIMKFL